MALKLGNVAAELLKGATTIPKGSTFKRMEKGRILRSRIVT